LASFENHIGQAKSNINFLLQTNSADIKYWDWQVTICFYIAVHTVNAHLAKSANLHYHTHESVKNILNTHNALSTCAVPIDVYLDYTKLEGLSRRSRYLCNHEDSKKDKEIAHMTFDKHFAKAIKRLDRLLDYFNSVHETKFGGYPITCADLQKVPLKVFICK
jgi:hypothetical protein